MLYVRYACHIFCLCFVFRFVGRLLRVYAARYILGVVWFPFFTMAQHPLVDESLLMIEDS
jgi:hypothetical protein